MHAGGVSFASLFVVYESLFERGDAAATTGGASTSTTQPIDAAVRVHLARVVQLLLDSWLGCVPTTSSS